MTKIQKLADDMCEELHSAKCYAEKYVEYKSLNNSQWLTRFKEMANDELKHAMYLHDLVLEEINTLSTVFTPPESMKEKWDKAHAKYVEKTAWIKQMLSM